MTLFQPRRGILALVLLALFPFIVMGQKITPPSVLIGPFTVSTLPTSVANTLTTITDGTSTSDCTTGGGSSFVLCRYSGSVWSAVGGGSMVYPGSGIPNSTGSAWGTSYGTSGSGSVCLTISCAMTTPNLGTPSALVLTNATGLPNASVIGLGTAALQNTGTSGATLGLLNGTLTFSGANAYGTPASIVLTNATGLPNASVIGLGAAALKANSFFLQAANNLSDVTAATARTNLGLGTAATQNTGTSGGNLGLLNGNLTFSGSNAYGTPASIVLAGATGLPTTGVASAQGNGSLFQLSTGTATSTALAEYDTNGNVISSPCSIVSSGITCTGPFSSGSGSGVAGIIDLLQGTAPTIPANAWGWLAPTSITTSWYGQPPNASPSANQVMLFGAPSSNVSTWAWTSVSGTGSFCMTVSCVMTTPNLGTPSAAVLTNATGLPPAAVTSAQGNGAKFQLSTGATTTNDCVKFDANGNTVDAGGACGSGAGASPGSSVFNITASTTITSTSATSVLGGAQTIPTGNFITSTPINVNVGGIYTVPTAYTGTATLAVFVDGSQIATTGTLTIPSTAVTNGSWSAQCQFTTYTTGSSGTYVFGCPVLFLPSSTATITVNGGSLAISSANTFDTTTSHTIDFKWTWSTATGSPSATGQWGTATVGGAPVTSVNAQTGAITLSTVNAQTSTYQVVTSDFSSCKTISVASGTFTITLVASSSQPTSGCVDILNYGSGVITLARSGQNINGVAANLTGTAGSATVPTGWHVTSDGSNYFAAISGGGGGASGGVATGCPSSNAAGAYVCLEAHTATSGTTTELDFTSWYSSTYDRYVIELEKVSPASSGGALDIQYSINGGSSWDASTIYNFSHFVWSSGGSAVSGASTQGAIQIFPYASRSLITSSTYLMHGTLALYDPGGAEDKLLFGDLLGPDNVATGTTAPQRLSVSGLYTGSSAVNAFRVFINSGTFGGLVRIYGISH